MLLESCTFCFLIHDRILDPTTTAKSIMIGDWRTGEGGGGQVGGAVA